MNGKSKILILMSFQDSYVVSTRNLLFQDELDWLFLRTGNRLTDALYISYAYKGTDFSAFFNDLSKIFASKGIRLTDISSGNPASLIAAAQIIVVGGGDIGAFMKKMNSLISSTFNPFTAIKQRVDSCIPFIGWNEGSAISSPKYLELPFYTITPAINISPFQIITNYSNPATNNNYIKNYLQANPAINKAICQVTRPDGTSVRLEESGAGILAIPTDPYPDTINYQLVNGVLMES